MFGSFSPNNCHNTKSETMSPAWRLSHEIEVQHLEMEVYLAVPCQSFFFFKRSVCFIAKGKDSWGANVDKRSTGMFFPVALLPSSLGSISMMQGACMVKSGFGFLCFGPVGFGVVDWAGVGCEVLHSHTAPAEGLCVPQAVFWRRQQNEWAKRVHVSLHSQTMSPWAYP